jgi:hypothetical protein
MVMPIPMWDAGALTGNKRVRKGWFGKIILQVEVEQTVVRPPTNLREHIDRARDTRRVWRDATASDVGLDAVRIPGVL